jgi:hypothetical protein
MNYNLTEKQKDLARWLVAEVRAKRIPESFIIEWLAPKPYIKGAQEEYKDIDLGSKLGRGELDALAEAKLLLQSISTIKSQSGNKTVEWTRQCTLTALAYRAVDTDFAEDGPILHASLAALPHPPEIGMPLERLRAKYPDSKKLGFLIMRFAAARPFERIVETIKARAQEHGLFIVRADENEFHADLWGNVRTLLHGCGFGIAVYERIETNEPNANVGLEVGYLMAMNKPVLLLKDKTVGTLQSDLAGKLYKPFDPHDPEGTIPTCLTKWLEDNGIIVPKHG